MNGGAKIRCVASYTTRENDAFSFRQFVWGCQGQLAHHPQIILGTALRDDR